VRRICLSFTLSVLLLGAFAPSAQASGLLRGLILRCLEPCLCPRPVVVVLPPAYVMPPAPIVSKPRPAEQADVLPPPQVLIPATRPMTHQEFAALFKPAPGTYEVVLLHPGSKCPVTVCFTLPAGCPEVRVHRRELIFDYGRYEVEIRFQIGGRVRVTYD
jgi:hypothetical protein